VTTLDEDLRELMREIAHEAPGPQPLLGRVQQRRRSRTRRWQASVGITVLALVLVAFVVHAPRAGTHGGTLTSVPTAGASEPDLGIETVPNLLRPHLVDVAERNAGRAPTQADVLAKAPAGADGDVEMLVGHISAAGTACIVGYSRQVPTSSFGTCGGSGSGSQTGITDVARFSGRPGRPGFISGRVPPGTTAVRVTAQGFNTVTTPAYSAGTRWGNACYFVVTWDGPRETTVEALAGDRPIAATTTP
jgi:hypothetical protein